MRAFLDKDFLLDTVTARVLYHEAAEKCPIIDYRWGICYTYSLKEFLWHWRVTVPP